MQNVETVVVEMIEGAVEVHSDIKIEVSWYRNYAEQRRQCVSFPTWLDDQANVVFDDMVRKMLKASVVDSLRA